MAGFQSLPGFRDFYPEDFFRRQHIFRIWRDAAFAHGFQEYDAPVLEPLELYTTKSGDEIEGQLFSFTDKGGRDVSLRPEMTPTVCRLVGAKAGALKRPIKWFSIAEFYRYERAQKGRLRAFHQLNADIFGEAGPEAEIELISLLVQCLTGFGLTKDDFYVRLSDRDLWFFFLEALGLNEAQARGILAAVDRFEKMGDAAFNGYVEQHGALDAGIKDRILAFLGVKSLTALEAILAPLGQAKLAARLADWKKVIGGLEAMGLGEFIQVDLAVVRGLAYYTGFVFEAFDRKGDLRALAGGGRYNNLIKKLGYADLPAVGFAIGDVTTGLLLEQRGLTPKYSVAPEVYVVIDGEAGRREALPCIRELRASGCRVEYPFKEQAFGKQFKAAAESGARIALIFGGDEIARGVVKIRDLTDRSEREVPRAEAVAAVKSALGSV
ncbi:MAG TPA: histidine--tRNA ligase [Candidatus Didemnitutus sp.]|nr:histidine--tRNA ligase [Candidatus Didemnitutus sp.]